MAAATPLLRVEVSYKVRIDEAKLNLAVMNPAIEHVRVIDAEIKDLAITMAPKRSGSLAAAHINAGVLRRGPWAAEGRINNVSLHAKYVHEGTDSPILPKGTWLRLREGGGYPVTFARSVRGQNANPWLFRAGEVVAARHGARASRVKSVGR